MAELPILSGREVVRAFGRGGWQMVRQKGSHMILIKPGHMATLSVPDHREIARGTLRSLIRSSGLSVAEFLELTAGQVSARRWATGRAKVFGLAVGGETGDRERVAGTRRCPRRCRAIECPRIGPLALDSDSTSAGFPKRRGRHSHFNAEAPRPFLADTSSLSRGTRPQEV
jgi:predicted RNA binding protein YcfA (HicA-like mRNA interferase family)